MAATAKQYKYTNAELAILKAASVVKDTSTSDDSWQKNEVHYAHRQAFCRIATATIGEARTRVKALLAEAGLQATDEFVKKNHPAKSGGTISIHYWLIDGQTFYLCRARYHAGYVFSADGEDSSVFLSEKASAQREEARAKQHHDMRVRASRALIASGFSPEEANYIIR